jgi:probable F420-dependent oxidoreductase
VKFCCHLAFGPTAHLVPMARAIEEAGYDTIALSDHVVHPETVRAPYPYTKDGSLRWEPFTDWPDPWVSVGAMAAVTERVRFVTGVYVLPMRNPFVVAKAVGTAAAISNDRVTLGIGTGWMRDEFELLEQPFERRGKRTDEMIAVLRTLWSGGMVEHHGEFYDFDRLEMSPVPSRPIPIVVGGLSEPALRRAATLGDGWFSDLHTTDELRGYLGRLRAYRADSPRASEPMQVLVSCMDAFDRDAYRRLEDIGVTHLVTKPWLFFGGAENDLASKIEGLKRFADAQLR